MKNLLIFSFIGLILLLGHAQASAAEPQIVAGERHTVALQDDGTVWTWGWNSAGQLGDGSFTDSSVPVSVLTGVAAVAAGSRHTLALKEDGTVWAWGSNSNGQLGYPAPSRPYENNDSNIPVQVPGLPENLAVVAIAADLNHNLVLLSDGTIRAWGFNSQGQLGNGTTADSYSPVQVAGLGSVTAIGAGYYHSLAVRDDGTVWAWGNNNKGQLGNGSWTNSSTPVQVSGLTNVVDIAAGAYHSVALKEDGTVLTWGRNDDNGQLGDGTLTNSSLPVEVLSGAAAIAAGPSHTVAIKNDGSVWVWGDNFFGQLGDGTTIDSYTPREIAGLTGITAIAAGNGHTLVLNDSGTVLSWGRNIEGQLGDSTFNDSFTPVQASSDLDLVTTQYFTVTATAGDNGTISPEGSVEVLGGTDITFTMMPVDGCSVESVLVDGLQADPFGTYPSPYSYYFFNLDQPHAISAEFSCPVVLGTSTYPSVQAAYDSIVEGTTEIIKMESTEFAEGLTFEREVTVVLKGGYDDSDSELQTGWTTISSSTGPALKISRGKVIIDRISLK